MFVPKLGRVTSTKPRTPKAQQTGVWLKPISDQALVSDPVAIAQCILPSCTDNIGLKPDAVKGVDRVCLQRVTVTFIGSAATIISTTRSSERGARIYAISCTRPSRRLSAAGSAYQRV